MVTTTSLNGDLDFRAAELFSSELPEDRQIAEMASEQLSNLVEKLVPVLVYVDQQIGQNRAVEVVKEKNDYSLILDRSGKWHLWIEDKIQQEDQAWERFIFGKVVEGLEHWFDEATKKKEAHQNAVAKRRDLLNKIGAVIRGEAVPAAE